MDLHYPTDNLTEKEVLAILIFTEQAKIRETIFAQLQQNSFQEGLHREIYAICEKLNEEQRDLDTRLISRETKIPDFDVSDYLTDIKPFDFSVTEKIKILRNLQLRREIIRLGADMVADGEKEEETDKILSKMEEGMTNLQQGRLERPYIPMPELVSAEVEKLRILKNGGKEDVEGYSVGLPDIPFELQPGRVYVIAGRPAHGKSTLTMLIVKAICIRMNIAGLFISLEENESSITRRLLFNQSGVSKELLGEKWDKLERGAKELSDSKMIVQMCSRLNIAELKGKGRHFATVRKCKLIAIDYLQLMDGYPHKKYTNEVEKISDITRALKALALSLDIPVIAVSQLSRKSEDRGDRRPQLADLRGSGSIEQDADIVAFVYRADCYKRKEEHTGEIEIITAKQRNGKTDSGTYKFDGATYRIEAISKMTPPPDYLDKDDQPF